MLGSALGRLLLPDDSLRRTSLIATGAVVSTAALAYLLQDLLNDSLRWLLGLDGTSPKLKPLRPGRKLKVAILGGGIGGSAVALWLRDAFGEDQVDIALITDGPIGGRCQTVELDGILYEAGATIISDMNVYFKALMRRFGLSRKPSGLNMPMAIFNGSRFLFCGVSTAALHGWGAVAKLLTSWQLALRYGFFSLLRLQSLARTSTAPNLPRLYRALYDGATYGHPRELLSTLGHGCLRLSERPADQWLVREIGLPGALVQELAEPGMRCNYGGQGCNELHAFVGLVSICGGICSKCFSVLGGNVQVPEMAVAVAEPRLLRGTARLVRRVPGFADAEPWEPTFEVGYDPSACGEAMKAGPSRVPTRAGKRENEVEGLLVEAFHLVVLAHPLEHSELSFEECCTGNIQRDGALQQYRRCVAHFLRGSPKLSRFAECVSSEAENGGGAVRTSFPKPAEADRFQVDEPAQIPEFAPVQILTTADSTTPFFSIGLQFPINMGSKEAALATLDGAERGEAQVYKVFAPKRLTEEELDQWFHRSPGTPVRVVDWYAYPEYSAPQRFRPFVLDPAGVYYVNAIEEVASAMEMSLIGARNAVNLIVDWVNQRRGPRGF